ncbi:glycoside hydrolase [Paenibacillus sp. FSL H8-0548]|nr:glycoside hydrolase [Paenibacillus sp. FSL H8-0548]
MKREDLQIRDPFIFPVTQQRKYYLYGSTDKNIWGKGTGFDAYTSHDLETWEGPFPAFRPSADFFSDTNFWAPEVYEHEGRYFMFATFRRNDNGLLGTAILASDQLLGPFELHSEGPVTPVNWSSLDGSLYVDQAKQPWMVFCHEWQQTADGEICAMKLSMDFKRAVSEPVVLFKASEAPWTTSFQSPRYPNQDNYVTDGPYLFHTASGVLYMLWASFINNKYALGIAKSLSGVVTGPWLHEEKAFYQNDGGHGMVFRTFEGRLVLTIHTPNQTPDERPIFIEVVEEDGELVLGEML